MEGGDVVVSARIDDGGTDGGRVEGREVGEEEDDDVGGEEDEVECVAFAGEEGCGHFCGFDFWL